MMTRSDPMLMLMLMLMRIVLAVRVVVLSLTNSRVEKSPSNVW